MTQFLPPNLLALFAPRDPIPYLAQVDRLPHEKKLTPYTGVAQFLAEFENTKDTPPPTRVETKDERKERKRKERAEQVAYKLEQDLAMWDPANNIPGEPTDPFKSLFIARINYDTSESKLRREFETYGPVRSVHMAMDQKTGKPRGYAFIEYEHERDMHSAYKNADGKKLDGRRVLVDVERGRTVKGWRPRRLGGGLGGTRKGGPDVNTRFSGRDGGTQRDRSNSREPDRDRRSRRSRSRTDRDRERPRRSRSRERRRPRSRDRSRRDSKSPERRERRRRSRSRDRKRRRSGSRDRRRRSRSDDRRRGRGEEEENYGDRAIKQEPEDAYAAYGGGAGGLGSDQGGGGLGSGEPKNGQPQYNEYGSHLPPPLPPSNGQDGQVNYEDM